MLRVVLYLLLFATSATLALPAVNQQVIFPPPEFDNATQFGIGVGATPIHDACFIIGYNLTDGRAFAQYYEEDLVNMTLYRVGDPVYGNVMQGFDATEMNPAGALLTTEKDVFLWSISTINNSNWAYGYAYYDHLESGVWTRRQTFTDPIPDASRLYAGALAGVNDGSMFLIGAAVYPVSGPSNTIPSTVELWERNLTSGDYQLNHTLSMIEERTGLYGYSLDITQNKRWIAVGAWNYRPRSVFLYDRHNNYSLAAQLAPFGNVSRFSYSLSFSPDGEWLVLGVFQYPGSSFVGAVAVYRFNTTLDAWDTENYYFLSTGFDIGLGAAGQGASVSISGPWQRTSDNTTSWTLVYGMPYLEVNSTIVGGVAVWSFDATISNWTETLPPLFGFGNLTTLSSPFYGGGDNTTRLNWRYNISGGEDDDAPPLALLSSNPYLNLGWTATPNRMISYDGCSVIVPGVSNIGISTGFVFRWLNVSEGCPRPIPIPTPPAEPPVAPVEPPITPPVTPPVTPPSSSPLPPPEEEPTPAATPASNTTAIAVSVVVAAVFAIVIFAMIYNYKSNLRLPTNNYY